MSLTINIPEEFIPFIKSHDEDSVKIIFPNGCGISIIKPKYNTGYEILVFNDGSYCRNPNYSFMKNLSELINKPLNQFNTIDNLTEEDVTNVLILLKVTDDLTQMYCKELLESIGINI